ncbi:MAG: non-canonical purine NTP pyrophosphatase [Phycisphaerales bacterium]|jgi:XTP/dITP diphosphohydrolase
MRIVLATSNPHKIDELRHIFAAESLADIDLVGLKDIPGTPPDPAETGTTFVENATIKAREYAAWAGVMCLADDSGIEIDALNGRPGVISSHYATDGRETGATREERDQANNARVMREMQDVPPERRTARFVCRMVLAEPPAEGRGGSPAASRVLFVATGHFEGRIGEAGVVPRGEHGFGYDPLFLVPPQYSRSAAELPAEEKNRLSHRGYAARAMAAFLRQM